MLTVYHTIKTHVKLFSTLLTIRVSNNWCICFFILFYFIFLGTFTYPCLFYDRYMGKRREFMQIMHIICCWYLLMFVLLFIYIICHKNINAGVYSSNILDLYKTAALLPFTTQSCIF